MTDVVTVEGLNEIVEAAAAAAGEEMPAGGGGLLGEDGVPAPPSAFVVLDGASGIGDIILG